MSLLLDLLAIEVSFSTCALAAIPSTLSTPNLKLAAKKPGLGPDTRSTSRPISNLAFPSQTLNPLSTQHSPLTSNLLGLASTHITALLIVTNNLVQLGILLLLGLTGALNTISHTVLHSCPQLSSNISGHRQEFVGTDSCSSSSNALLLQGVPQGCGLGPLLFILHMLPPSPGKSPLSHGLLSHSDSIQLLTSTLTKCLTEIKPWMH